MKFSILVPAYNEEQSISSCLNSLISVVYDDKEIIVIDDASTDHTVQTVEKFLGKDVILVRRGKEWRKGCCLKLRVTTSYWRCYYHNRCRYCSAFRLVTKV